MLPPSERWRECRGVGMGLAVERRRVIGRVRDFVERVRVDCIMVDCRRLISEEGFGLL